MMKKNTDFKEAYKGPLKTLGTIKYLPLKGVWLLILFSPETKI